MIGLTLITIPLTFLAIRCGTWTNRLTVMAFWAAYAAVALVFAGVL